MSNPLARRARIKDLSNKAEGIFQYIGNDNVLFRLISTGNKLTSDVNYAVALFTGFARSHQLGSQETRRTIDSIYRRVGELMCLIDIVHAAAGEEIMPEPYESIDFCYMTEYRTMLREAVIRGMPDNYKGPAQNPYTVSLVQPGVGHGNGYTLDEYDDDFFARFTRRESRVTGSSSSAALNPSLTPSSVTPISSILNLPRRKFIMPEKNQTPIEMLDQNAAVVQSAEVPAPASPIQLQQRQSYAEKVQGLTIDERNWMLAKSKAAAMAQLPAGFLPQTYTGNPGACAIACEMALRMGVSHLFVMQNLYVVHGMPTWSGKSCKALIDNSGQFAGRTRYRMEGEEGTENWGCRLIGVDKLTGEKVEGPKVTVKMAKDAGWWDKNGSYWPKMTEMMLKYRAAAYFARAECPEVLMGANIDYEVGAGDAEEEGAAHA